jgi:acyl-CoA synthetase (AMP-forming)/AMP-acid ligase II/thioesterase domain-containing protein/aryl carrier-like protein
MSLKNLLILLENVAAQPESGKIICYPEGGGTREYKAWTYRDLFVEAKRASCALQSSCDNKFGRGARVLLHFTSHWDNIVWFWAVLLAGGIPVMSTALPSSEPLRTAHLMHLAGTLINPVCLTSSVLASEFSGQTAVSPVTVESLDLPEQVTSTIGPLKDELGFGDTATILLTSGSTGRCKAVCLTHGQILAATGGKVAALPRLGNSFLNWIRLDHVAAIIEVHIQAILAHKTQVHVPASTLLAAPTTFLDLIDIHRVSRAFAPNFFLAKLRDALRKHTIPSTPNAQSDGVATNGDHKATSPSSWDLSCLRCITSGGETNLTRTCDEISDQLAQYGAPKNVIFPGFGMTETCAGAIYNAECPQYERDHQLEFASLGRCMPGIKMRVTDSPDSTESLAAGRVGFLQLTGPVVFKQYFNNKQATDEAFTSDGWFITGDKAFIDTNDCLNLAGRSKETMIVNGINHDPQSVEAAVEEAHIPGVASNFICCFSFLPPGGETERIYLVYLPEYSTDNVQARVETTNAIAKAVLMATGAHPEVFPIDKAHFQKSSLGKLSRARIKAAYIQGEFNTQLDLNRNLVKKFRKQARTPPKDKFESEILAVVINCLGPMDEDEFGVQTPLLDLGITSIELISLKKELEATLRLHQDIPIIMLLTNPTVRDLSAALSKLQSSRGYDPVVRLQTGGKKTPLWLVHPGVGEVLVFLNLASFLQDRPVYALRARGLTGDESPFANIAEAVSIYHSAIKDIQPVGPYAIAGYSYGTMLAFEISKVLEADNDRVAFTGSFNLPPHIKERMCQLDFKECLLNLSYFLGLMTEERARELAVELGGCPRDLALSTIMKNASLPRLAELALSESALDRWASVAFALQSMAVDYEPSGSVAGFDCFYCIPLAVVATSKQQWLDDHLSKWKDFSRSKVRFHSVGGAHYTMLSPEHVFEFQKTLRRALEKRGL